MLLLSENCALCPANTVPSPLPDQKSLSHSFCPGVIICSASVPEPLPAGRCQLPVCCVILPASSAPCLNPLAIFQKDFRGLNRTRAS